MRERVMIGFGFTSDWLKSGASFLSQSLSAEIQSQLRFDAQMKTALFIFGIVQDRILDKTLISFMSFRHVHSVEQILFKVSFNGEICVDSAIFITYVRYDMLLNNNAVTSSCTNEVLMFKVLTSGHDVF